MVTGLFRLLNEDWIDDLDFDTVQRLPAEHVARDARVRREDMPWTVAFRSASRLPSPASVLLQIEFQSRVDPYMAERMLEYAAMMRRDWLRAMRPADRNAAAPAIVGLVVYDGHAPWTAPTKVESRTAWVPASLAAWQPRYAFRVLDVRDFAGDDASDGNLARAALALEAAPVALLSRSLERVVELLRDDDYAYLTEAFETWCEGVLRPRFGDRMPSFAQLMERPPMLAETLKEWEGRKLREGIGLGRAEGIDVGRAEGIDLGRAEGIQRERALLMRQAARRFGPSTGEALRGLLTEMADDQHLARVGDLIVDCSSGTELLHESQRLARRTRNASASRRR